MIITNFFQYSCLFCLSIYIASYFSSFFSTSALGSRGILLQPLFYRRQIGRWSRSNTQLVALHLFLHLHNSIQSSRVDWLQFK